MKLKNPIFNPLSNFFLFIALLFGILAAFIFLMGIFPNLGALFNLARCKVYGGAWFEGKTRMCIIKYSDAGKTCYADGDCKGKCFASGPNSTSGICAKNNLFYGDICILKYKGQKPECVFFNPFK
ncbi:hypothetical protein A2V49_01200 [candidate division WWE3 bacterium RBG_19FT_COMBO_34_6]|uniref:Uncharacterized protein n=1 Tax=candidate division WWE3 bacterium RBG_19FT_COMBO_34_6 TaxID=1802612 RepID=A0A1F4UJW8_UNCKA|nr:MAG: hypothetical protein A2V49_01200 [candidate division WWE3 bacterium RBG_19FT_COMBO_34_6]